VTETESPTPRAASFGRDVLVNVLANLIAAAIIYLGAVITGYITPSRLLVIISGGLVLLTIGTFISDVRAVRYNGMPTRRHKIVAVVLGVGGLALIVGSVWFFVSVIS
jgi:hypothetical protein